MNILDENILQSQLQILPGWRITARQIGEDLGRKGMKDDEIISLLVDWRRSSFFTRDLGFYERKLRCFCGRIRACQFGVGLTS